MAISTEFTYTVKSVKRDLSDGFITDAVWSLVAIAKSDGAGIATTKYQSVAGFGTSRPSPMIAYNDVTEANVITWVINDMGTTGENELKANLSNILLGIYNPPAPTTGNGVPW